MQAAPQHVCVVVGDPIADPQGTAAWICSGRTPAAANARTFTSGVVSIPFKGGQLPVQLETCESPELLAVMMPPPTVAVMCYTPLAPHSHESLANVWGRNVDRMFPRPMVIVAGTRVESLGNRKVLEKMKKDGLVPVSVDEACDSLSRYRAVNYVEVSAASNVGLGELLNAIACAAVGEAARRATPEIANIMRSACIQTMASKQSLWVWRRDRRDGRLFFYNRVTRKSTWERPLDYDGEEPELTRDEEDAEEQRRRDEEEARLQGEREKAMAQLYIKELAEHEQRMLEMETRSDRLTTQVANMNQILEAIKKQIQVNATERVKLERMKESISTTELVLAKTTVDEDEKLERELQLARNRAFELEAVSTLKLEQDFDLQLSENLIRNRSLATHLRELLQEQLQIQKQGAQVQAKCVVATKAVEESAKSGSFLTTKAANTLQQVRIVEAELKPLDERHRLLVEELRGLQSRLSDANYAEIDRHRRERQLLALCGECDARIVELKANTNAAVRKETHDDRRRLALERRGLAASLAQTAAECAVLERQLAAKHLQLDHLNVERQALASKLVDVMASRLETAQRLKARYFEGPGFSPVPNAEVAHTINELLALQQMFDVGRGDGVYATGSQMATSVFGIASKDGTPTTHRQLKNAAAMSKFLTNRLEDLDAKGRAVVSRVRAAADELRQLKGEIGEDSVRAASAIESASELLRTVAAVGATAVPQPLERLKSKASPALLNDPSEMRVVVETFAKHILRHVPAGELHALASSSDGGGKHSAATELLEADAASRRAASAALKSAADDYSQLAAAMSTSLSGAMTPRASPSANSGRGGESSNSSTGHRNSAARRQR